MRTQIIFLFTFLCMMAQNTWADSYNYVYYTVNDDGRTLTKHTDGATPADANMLLSSTNVTDSKFTNQGGWWVVDGSVTHEGRLMVEHDVNLLLRNHSSLNAKAGIFIKQGVTLTVYSEGDDSDMSILGELHANTKRNDHAAIGGEKNKMAGNFVMHGGKVYAQAHYHYGAGIGGGYGDGSGIQSVTIYGGLVWAHGHDGGAGIGKGKNNNHWETIKIYGGQITAFGGKEGAGIGGGRNRGNGEIFIYGGTVNATSGEYGAGIGGGSGGDVDKAIHIYGGTVTATGDNYYNYLGGAGIGGGSRGSQKSLIEITGGTVTATGGCYDPQEDQGGAGIGGGSFGHGGTLNISGDNTYVHATGMGQGAGIGGGYSGDGGNITISGGTVVAEVGGKIKWRAAAIGGGSFGNCADVTITGGNVRAIAHMLGTGIGGGYRSDKTGTITISGGTVVVVTDGDYAAAINGGCGIGLNGGLGGGKRTPPTIVLGDGMSVVTGDTEADLSDESKRVVAQNRALRVLDHHTAKIEPCFHNVYTYTNITADQHTKACKYCKAISVTEGHNFPQPGNVCDCGYVEGDVANLYGVAFFQTATTSPSGYGSSLFQGYVNQGLIMPECTIKPDGYDFVGWLLRAEDGAPASIEASDSEASNTKQPGDEMYISGNVTFFARYQIHFDETWEWADDYSSATVTIKSGDEQYVLTADVTSTRTEPTATTEGSIDYIATATYERNGKVLTFTDDCFKPLYYALSLGEEDNENAITGSTGNTVTATLTSRTLYKDGKWNTLTLPFDITLSGSILEGAVAHAVIGANITGTTLNLQFSDAVEELEAGTPYIIKWANDTENPTIYSPVFEGVTISADKHDYDSNGEGVITEDRVRFVGTYKTISFDSEDKTILLMGEGNTLFYPAAGAGVRAQRAYFKIGEDDASNAPALLTSFNINFGDDEVTGILTTNVTNGTKSDGAWYTLDGRKLVGKPTQNGIYINNGKKVVIK